MSVTLLRNKRVLLVNDLFDKIVSFDKIKTMGDFDTVVIKDLCGNSYFYNVSKFTDYKMVCLDKSLTVMHPQDQNKLINHNNLYTIDPHFAKKYNKHTINKSNEMDYNKLLSFIGTGKIISKPKNDNTRYEMTHHHDITYEIVE